MKKTIIAFLFALTSLTVFLFSSDLLYARAEDGYGTFQSMTFDNGDYVEFIKYWNNDKINSLINKNFKKKMFGWDVLYTYRGKHFHFIDETLYSVRNTSDEAITQTFKTKSSNEEVIKRKVKGSLEISGGATVKQFKFGLESHLEYTYEKNTTTTSLEENELKLKVAPYSELRIDVRGEGYFYQGVARKTAFWIPFKKGAFEYIVITTKYYSINMWGF